MEYNHLDDVYDVEISNITTNSSSYSSSAYSYSIDYVYCPTLTVERAKDLIKTSAPMYTSGDKIFMEFVLPLLLCVGLVGNLLFIYVVCSMSTMRTATNWCLANLAVADLVFLTFGIGEKLWMYHHSPFVNDRYSFGEFGCPVVFAIIDASYFAALCMVTLVSMERYYAVCRTQSARTNTRKSMFIVLVVLSWVISIGIAASFVPASNFIWIGCRVWPDVEPYKNLPIYKGFCIASEGFEKFPLYLNIIKTIPFFLLISFNLFLYVCIVRSMSRAVRETRFAGREDTNLKQRNQVAGMLMVNGLIFFICLVPFEIFGILKAINMIRPEDSPLVTESVTVPLRYTSQTMSYINNVVNPVVYIGLSKRYRDAFKKAIMCRKRPGYSSRVKSRTRSSTTTSTALSVHVSRPVNVQGTV
ncbi:allatostatin-A receptor-like [Lytechinus pictus]|uniref:allatostatin-A receptor-like n=1 Tax=Lytechinus pictus TaxID=7653 RepID=UPI00240E008A|nr:allatostatin-A receptor-like [Lytechinus pictus]